jgi:hypothetical protein
MSIVARMVRGLVELFVDDGTLALTLIVVLATVGLLAHYDAIEETLAMVMLVAGTIGALLVNVIRAASANR